MSALKHLKTLQHVSIIIQIIFRELVGSLLKSMDLKVFQNCKSQLWWCGSIKFGVCARRGHAHTPNVMLPHQYNWLLQF